MFYYYCLFFQAVVWLMFLSGGDAIIHQYPVIVPPLDHRSPVLHRKASEPTLSYRLA